MPPVDVDSRSEGGRLDVWAGLVGVFIRNVCCDWIRKKKAQSRLVGDMSLEGKNFGGKIFFYFFFFKW